jgi:hypothetical protein
MKLTDHIASKWEMQCKRLSEKKKNEGKTLLRNTVLWHPVALCTLAEVDTCFGRMYYLHIQDGKVSHTSNHQEKGRAQSALLVSCFAYSPIQKLVAIFLRNVGPLPKSVGPTCQQTRAIYYTKRNWLQIPHIMAVQLPNIDMPLPTRQGSIGYFRSVLRIPYSTTLKYEPMSANVK